LTKHTVTAIVALAGFLGAAIAAPHPSNGAVDVVSSAEKEVNDLLQLTLEEHQAGGVGNLQKRGYSAACWICLAGCGLGGDCGCCAPGRVCENYC
jgi:hypothetical protein